MIKITFNGDLENKGKNSSIEYTFEKTTTFEIELMIAKTMQLITQNNPKAKKEVILKEIGVLFDTFIKDAKNKEKKKKGNKNGK